MRCSSLYGSWQPVRKSSHLRHLNSPPRLRRLLPLLPSKRPPRSPVRPHFQPQPRLFRPRLWCQPWPQAPLFLRPDPPALRRLFLLLRPRHQQPFRRQPSQHRHSQIRTLLRSSGETCSSSFPQLSRTAWTQIWAKTSCRTSSRNPYRPRSQHGLQQ